MRTRSVRLDDDQEAALAALATLDGILPSEVLRNAFTFYFCQRVNDDPPLGTIVQEAAQRKIIRSMKEVEESLGITVDLTVVSGALITGSAVHERVLVSIDDLLKQEEGNDTSRLKTLERAWNCLTGRAGLTTVEELLTKSDRELLGITQFGATCLRVVDEELAKYGLKRRPGVNQ